MTKARGLMGVGLLGVLVLVVSCAGLDSTVMVPPDVPGATAVGSAACAECHARLAATFPGSAHGRRDKPDPAWALQTGCESCHGPGSRHVATGEREWIVNPGRDPAVCFRCHLRVESEFAMPNRHPVMEGRIQCGSCHDPHGTDIRQPPGGLAMARGNATCGACHRAQHQPFVFEHEALREGCTVCHVPHGSESPKLLTVRDSNLCLKCHAQNLASSGGVAIGKVDHTDYLRMGTCYSAGCHMAVHGSNLQPKLRY